VGANEDVAVKAPGICLDGRLETKHAELCSAQRKWRGMDREGERKGRREGGERESVN